MPTSSRETPNRTAIPLQIRWQGKATNAPPSHNAYTRAYFSRAILGPWGSLVYPWWFGTTRLRFKSGRTHLHSSSEPRVASSSDARASCEGTGRCAASLYRVSLHPGKSNIISRLGWTLGRDDGDV